MSSGADFVLGMEDIQESSMREASAFPDAALKGSENPECEASPNQIFKMRKRRDKIIAAIYFDINHVSILRSFFRMRRGAGAAHHGMIRYRSECARAAAFVDHIVAQTATTCVSEPLDLDEDVKSQIRQPDEQRYVALVTQLGWRLLAICAHSEAFRRACEETDRTQWNMLLEEIWHNRRSIEVFARSRSLEWRAPLLHHRNRSIYETLTRPHIDLTVVGHPHHLVRMMDRSVSCPIFENKLQKHIDCPIFRSRNWPLGRRDPTMRIPADGECDLCYSKRVCDCAPPSLAGCLVEIVQYPRKGFGVRALANFKKDDILDLYLGELRPSNFNGDPIYCLLQEPKAGHRTRQALISSKQYGNWTRFINHSCDPSTAFRRRTIGDRIYVTVEVI
jgi:Proteins containing SET domain